MGAQFRKMVQTIRSRGDSAVPGSRTALVLPDTLTPDLDFADAFFRLIDQGILPAIVLESNASDTGYLEARKLSTLVAFHSTADAVNAGGE